MTSSQSDKSDELKSALIEAFLDPNSDELDQVAQSKESLKRDLAMLEENIDASLDRLKVKFQQTVETVLKRIQQYEKDLQQSEEPAKENKEQLESKQPNFEGSDLNQLESKDLSKEENEMIQNVQNLESEDKQQTTDNNIAVSNNEEDNPNPVRRSTRNRST